MADNSMNFVSSLIYGNLGTAELGPPPAGATNHLDGSTMVERPRRPARDLERISRGAIIAIALSGATLAPLMAVNAQELAAEKCVPWTPIPAGDPNTYTGTCKGLLDYIKNTGVTTDLGNEHCPKLAGVTGIGDLSVDLGRIDLRFERPVFCACNDTIYNNPQVCLNECRVFLGCFSGICGPAPFPQVCVQGQIRSPTALSPSPIRVMRWRPKRQLNSACAAFMRAFDIEVGAHEEAHYADNQKLADDAAFKLKNNAYRACGATEEEAIERVTAEAQRDAQRVVEQFDLEAMVAAKRRHDSGEVQIHGCGLCDQ